jgi:isopropylmalate/homocitrate/citramalate synthase
VIDCTLRDGEQAPGVWFTLEEKLTLAKMLSEAGVTVLDAGFPASSSSDAEAMVAMRELGLNARIGATARPVASDIRAAARARADEVFLFMPTSDLRLHDVMGITREHAFDTLLAGSELVAALGMTLNVVFEDATRADPRYLIDTADRLRQRLPVARLILADSVGCAEPATMARLMTEVDDALDRDVVLCTHCHNDFGLATASTLAAVGAGAKAITCTVNGIGERAGNADLAECVAAMTHLYGVEHSVEPLALVGLSELVEELSGVHTSPIKPVTGFNVYRHESGVHVDALLKERRSYEFLPAEWVGRTIEYVLGKHSGASLVRHLLVLAGLPCHDAEVRADLREIKRRTERRDKSDFRAAYAVRNSFLRTALSGQNQQALVDAHLHHDVPGPRELV